MFFDYYIFNVYYWIVYVNNNTNAYVMFVSWICYQSHKKTWRKDFFFAFTTVDINNIIKLFLWCGQFHNKCSSYVIQ